MTDPMSGLHHPMCPGDPECYALCPVSSDYAAGWRDAARLVAEGAWSHVDDITDALAATPTETHDD